MTAKRWFDLECRHCGGRFLEAAKLLFHRCPGETDARRPRRKGDRRATRAKVATPGAVA